MMQERMCSEQPCRRGFTLMELLIVLVVILTAMSLLLPALQQAREDARMQTCQNNLKIMGLALHNYHDVYRLFPPGNLTRFQVAPPWKANNCFRPEQAENRENSYAPWTVALLPFVEHAQLYDGVNCSEKFTSNPVDGRGADVNHALFDEVIDVYRCPSDPHVEDWKPRLCYFGVAGGGPAHLCTATKERKLGHDMRGAMFFNSSVGVRDMIDGTVNTLLVGESRYQTFNDPDGKNYGWASSSDVSPEGGFGGTFGTVIEPINSGEPGLNGPREQASRFGSYHKGGANFLTADGAVHLLNEKMDVKMLRLMAVRNDRQVVEFEPLETLDRRAPPVIEKSNRSRRPGPR